jgi:hypothetical protein
VKRSLAVLGGICAVAAGCGSQSRPTQSHYLAEVSAICQRYGKQLDRIPPPSDLAIAGEVAGSVRLALPILRRQAAEIRAVRPPDALRGRLHAFFVLADRTIAELKQTLAAANRRDLGTMGAALVRFTVTRDSAKKLARAIGFRCD